MTFVHTFLRCPLPHQALDGGELMLEQHALASRHLPLAVQGRCQG